MRSSTQTALACPSSTGSSIQRLTASSVQMLRRWQRSWTGSSLSYHGLTVLISQGIRNRHSLQLGALSSFVLKHTAAVLGTGSLSVDLLDDEIIVLSRHCGTIVQGAVQRRDGMGQHKGERQQGISER